MSDSEHIQFLIQELADAGELAEKNFKDVLRLEQQLKEANKVIEYYGNKDSWHGCKIDGLNTHLCDWRQDMEEYESIPHDYCDGATYGQGSAGKKARDYLEKYPKDES